MGILVCFLGPTDGGRPWFCIVTRLLCPRYCFIGVPCMACADGGRGRLTSTSQDPIPPIGSLVQTGTSRGRLRLLRGLWLFLLKSLGALLTTALFCRIIYRCFRRSSNSPVDHEYLFAISVSIQSNTVNTTYSNFFSSSQNPPHHR